MLIVITTCSCCSSTNPIMQNVSQDFAGQVNLPVSRSGVMAKVQNGRLS